MSAFEILALDPAIPQIRAPGATDTYVFPRAVTPSANSTGITISGYSLTGTNAQSLLDLSGTWNTTGTPTALKLNVTDTASNASSLLLDLQVGGVSKFNIQKDGSIVLPASANSQINGNTGFGGAVQNIKIFTTATPNLINLSSTALIGWASGLPNSTYDTALFRDAANTLAQRNGVNAQTSRIYNTYTDASNYERGIVGWSANELFIGTESAGSGTRRFPALTSNGSYLLTYANTSGGAVRIWNAANTSTTNIYPNKSTNTQTIEGTNPVIALGPQDGAYYHAFRSDGSYELTKVTAPASPAANKARFFAQDNGSGKVQLCVLFPSGAVQVIATEP